MPPDTEFQIQLRAYVSALPGGATAAGKICGVTRQTIHKWLRGAGSPPNTATQVGALSLLAMALPDPPPAKPAPYPAEK
jgi:hypothetical protein